MPINICPDRGTLIEFMLGKLPLTEQENTELHIAECDPCGDTLRSLKVHDTLDELACVALQKSPDIEVGSEQDQAMVQSLIEKIKQNENQTSSLGMAAAKQILDRAAEVQHLLDAPKNDIDLGQIDHYRIQRLLGAGSTGVVYQAFDEQLERAVALKILRPSLGEPARHRFIAEARATAAISHPHVVTIYQVSGDGPLAYIAMQWLPGETLEEYLDRNETMPVDDVRRLGTEVASGLAAAHANGLIHRDIKPANIWIESDSGSAKILDFGLVRVTDEDPQLTCTGLIAGTPCYMSPEQSRGAKLDARSDIFSLGCLMYQAATGRLPFRSDNALATLQSIQRDQPVPPNDLDPSIPVDLSDLTMCLLEKSPNRRPSQIDEVAEALQSHRNDWSFDVLPSRHLAKQKIGEKRTGTSRGSFWVRGWVALIALATIGLGGYMFGPDVTRIITDQGQIVIESDDPNIKIEILQNGKQIQILDVSTNDRIDIKSGVYEFRPVGDQNSIVMTPDQLVLKRGAKQIVKVTRQAVQAESFNPAMSGNYQLDSGDVLAVFIDGVLGEFNKAPPVHYPPPESGLLPSTGYPVVIRSDGQIHLPLIKPVALRQLTVGQAEQLIRRAYTSGPNPLLKSDSRILVSLMRPRNYKPRAAATPGTDSTDPAAAKSMVDWSGHKIRSGDVMGIFVEGVLGNFEADPPVHYPPPETGLPPCIGYPIPVRHDGTVSVPLVQPIPVNGLTISQAESIIKRAYQHGPDPLLREDARILVSLIRVVGKPAQNATSGLGADSESEAESVFQNKNYRQWLSIAKREQDPESTQQAIEALAALANESQLDDLLQIVSDSVRRPNAADANVNWKILFSLFGRLNAEQMGDFLVNEVDNGNLFSRQAIRLPFVYLQQPVDRQPWKRIRNALRSQTVRVTEATEQLQQRTTDAETKAFTEKFLGDLAYRLKNTDEIQSFSFSGLNAGGGPAGAEGTSGSVGNLGMEGGEVRPDGSSAGSLGLDHDYPLNVASVWSDDIAIKAKPIQLEIEIANKDQNSVKDLDVELGFLKNVRRFKFLPRKSGLEIVAKSSDNRRHSLIRKPTLGAGQKISFAIELTPQNAGKLMVEIATQTKGRQQVSSFSVIQVLTEEQPPAAGTEDPGSKQ